MAPRKPYEGVLGSKLPFPIYVRKPSEDVLGGCELDVRKPYKGVLRRKLPFPLDVSLEQYLNAVLDRVVALADHHGLDLRLPGTMEALLAMGRHHAECFKIAKKPGRKPKPWQWANDLELFVEIYKGREKGDLDTKAYRRLARQRGFKEDEIEKAVSTLHRRFYDLTNPKTETQRRASTRMRRHIAQIKEIK